MDRPRVAHLYFQAQRPTTAAASGVFGRIQQGGTHALAARLRLRGQRVHPCELAVFAEKQHRGAKEMVVAGAGYQHLRGVAVQMATVLGTAEAIAVERALFEQHQFVEVGVFAATHVHARVLRRNLRGALRLPARDGAGLVRNGGGECRHARTLTVCA